MAIPQALLKELRAHRFGTAKNTVTITYAELNDKADKKSPTDLANDIHKTIKGSSIKEKQKLLDAMFDGTYTVTVDSNGNFSVMDKKTNKTTELKITSTKGILEFSASDPKIKFTVKIGTPEVVTQTISQETAAAEMAHLEKKFKTKLDLNKVDAKKLKEIADAVKVLEDSDIQFIDKMDSKKFGDLQKILESMAGTH